MTPQEILKLLETAGAIKYGHFLLSSGLHSDTYIDKFQVLQYPKYTEKLCQQLAKPFVNKAVEAVVGPTTGGIILAYEVAKILSPATRALFAEPKDNKRVFRPAIQIVPGERVIIVDDVVTTGTTTNQLIELVNYYKANLIGITIIVDRSDIEGELTFGDIPTYKLLRLKLKTYKPQGCPLCSQQLPLIRLGGV